MIPVGDKCLDCHLVILVGLLRDASQEELEAMALASEKVRVFTDGKAIRRVIVVPNKLVNLVVG